MNKLFANKDRILLTVIVLSCVIGGLFPFLNIDIGFMILTPVRTVSILASIWCLAKWCVRFRKKEALPLLKNNLLEWLTFGFFAAWFVMGVAWILLGETGANASAEIMGILTVGMLAFCVFTLTRDGADVHFLLHLCVLCGVFLAVLACVEAVVGNLVPGTKFYFTLEEKIEMKQTLFAPTTVFFNPNDFAAYLLLCISVVCFWIIRAETTRDFLINIGLAVVLTVPAVLIDSTIFDLFSCALIGLTVLGLLLVRRGGWNHRLLRASGIVLVAILFSLFCTDGIRSAAVQLNRSYFTAQIQNYYLQNQTPDPTEDSLQNPVQDTSEPGEEVPTVPTTLPTVPELDFSKTEDPATLESQLDALANNGGTIHIRLWLIRAGLDFFRESPIVGWGPDSFGMKISQNRDYLNQTRWIQSPHFFYTELLSQYGIIMFVAYMGIILYLGIRSLILTIRELREGRPGKGMLCLLLTGTFSAVIIMPSSIIRLTPIWIFLILAVCFFCKYQKAEQ